ncbi:MAG: sensor histidine kinase [Oscillospiraceae bacterium]|nr:sensor histidine kinase [Oscillospiraceae bacterium]
MFTLSSDVLSLTDEPAALLRNRRLVYANHAALAILGSGCVGKGIRELFGSEIAEIQAPNFVAATEVGGRTLLLRFCRTEDMQLVFFSPPETDSALLSDAYLQALRCALMNINLATAAGRSIADALAHAELQRCFSSLSREYYAMTRLLSNLETARAVLSGDLTTALTAVDPGAQLSELIDSLSLLRPDIHFHFTADHGVLLWADPRLLELMLMNLLSNCLTHAKGAQNVRISLSTYPEQIYISVRDDGCGIAPENMNGLFHRYRRVMPLRELSLGAGLGMTVIRGIAAAHGGTLLLESRENVGTTARVSLSRKLGTEAKLQERYRPYHSGMDRLLAGLAACLPPECFGGKYLD